jgi:class 3 adenylate cyclase
VDWTETTMDIIEPDRLGKYYEIFLDTISAVARNFGARIIKNVGGYLIFYHPKTESSNELAFRDVLKACIKLIATRCTINRKLYEERLAPISYRISANYGRVEVVRSASSQSDDLFGSTMNICARINLRAPLLME